MPDNDTETLADRRERMNDFLLENLVAEEKTAIDDGILAVDRRGRKFRLMTLSRQSDFPVEFDENPKSFDEDRRRLFTIRDAVRQKVIAVNSAGEIPGFIFLCGAIDYEAMAGLPRRMVNSDHFRKQALNVDGNKTPHYDLKFLDPLELVIMQFYRLTDKTSRMARVVGSRGMPSMRYVPEIAYFNSIRGNVEVSFYADYNDPKRFAGINCPECSHPNTTEYDHEGCKSGKIYERYVISRNQARYVKRMIISRSRNKLSTGELESRSNGVRLATATLKADSVMLGLPKGTNYQIARFV